MKHPRTAHLELERIQPPAAPIRINIHPAGLQELADSLHRHGQLQPILVTRTEDDKYEIIDGHRRYLAAELLAWQRISATIRDKADHHQLLSAIANIQREQLTPIEEARVVHTLVVEQKFDVDFVAQRFCKSRAWVDGRLEILDWPADLYDAVHFHAMPLAVAKELTRVKDRAYRDHLIDTWKSNGGSSLTARIWADDWQRQYQETGQVLTADTNPQPPYSGQRVGVECGGCGKMYPVDHLTTIYVCRTCIQPEPQKSLDTHDVTPRQ